ncbi:MAG TPA: hypothetical protein DCE12_09555, partial [Gammaproteobacteria bacterium]|nr:hypothetical protein [Gammaproteobacteria bacterium]
MNLLSDRPANPTFVYVTLILCAVASVIASAWCIHIDDVINNDGVEYIRAAEQFAARNWAGAFAVHQWPFFSFLMWATGAALGTSYETAGQLLNTFFFTLSSLLFVGVVRAFGGTSQRLTALAALVAVLHPAFNEYRAFIIRDAGYLAFYLLALFFLAKSIQVWRWRYSVFVVSALLAASIFRIEGAVFLLSAPLLIMTARGENGGSPWTRLVLTVMAAAVLALVLGWWLIAPGGGAVANVAASSPLEVIGTAWHEITSSVSHKIAVLRTEFLGTYAAEYAWTLFVFAVIMILLSATFSQLTIPWALLTFGGLVVGVRFPHKSLNRIWLTLVGMHLAILLVFAVIKLFLAARYPLALAVTILILIPFALERVAQAIRWHELKTPARVLTVVLLLWAGGESISGLDNATRASAIKDAGLWLKDRATTPQSVV